MLLDRRGPVVAARCQVELDKLLAQHLGHRSLRAALCHLHLEQPVLRDGIGIAIEKLVGGIRVDMRHAILVTLDHDLLRGTGRGRMRRRKTNGNIRDAAKGEDDGSRCNAGKAGAQGHDVSGVFFLYGSGTS